MISIDELRQFYMENSDLPFELEIHEFLKGNGCHSVHGGRYADPFLNKLREYDISAIPPGTVLRGINKNWSFKKVELLIECKNIRPECPIIVGSRIRELDFTMHPYLHKYNDGRIANFPHSVDVDKIINIQSAFGNNFISYIGTEVVQIPKNRTTQKSLDSNTTYDKWSQAINRSIVRYGEMAKEIKESSSIGEYPFWCVPILVVPDDLLYMSRKNNGGDFEIIKTCGIEVKVGYDFVINDIAGEAVSISSFFIFTKTGIGKFVNVFEK